MAKNSALSLIHFVWIKLSTTPLLNWNLLWASHNCQIPMGNTIFHGIPKWSKTALVEQVNSNHFSTSWSKVNKSSWGTLSLRQRSWATLHLLNKWSIDSFSWWQIVHKGLRFKPLEPRISLVGKLLWAHSHIKNWICGCVSAFQIHDMEEIPRFKGFEPLAKR